MSLLLILIFPWHYNLYQPQCHLGVQTKPEIAPGHICNECGQYAVVRTQRDLPVNQYTATRFNSALDEFVACRKMLEQVFVLHIVDFNSHVFEAIE